MPREIVRDLADYPDEPAARASLPEMYADLPYVGLYRLSDAVDDQGHPMEAWVYVFSERTGADLLAEGWTEHPF